MPLSNMTSFEVSCQTG